MPVAAEKKRITLLSGPATTAITGEKCTAYNVHYTYNNWALANGTGREVVKQGGDTWFFVTADYVFGKSLEEDTANGGEGRRRQGAGRGPPPSRAAPTSPATCSRPRPPAPRSIGMANAGADTINTIKQAKEFGVTPKQTLAGLLVFISDVHSLGLEIAKGMYLTTAFYWDLRRRRPAPGRSASRTTPTTRRRPCPPWSRPASTRRSPTT